MQSALAIHPPAPALRPFVRHYWLSLNNADLLHTALPDGCTDLVLEVLGNDWHAWAYGSTTCPTALPCLPGAHYLGIRFRPGQSRHFLRACAGELTDRREDAQPLLRFAPEPIAEGVANTGVFAELDRRLTALLCVSPPQACLADVLVRRIERQHGAVRLDELAIRLGRSERQLQRLFLETVGVTPKFFAMIMRAERAMQLIRSDDRAGLADVAAQTGYADQSHMTRDMARLTGGSPGHWRVAFFQDARGRDTEHRPRHP